MIMIMIIIINDNAATHARKLSLKSVSTVVVATTSWNANLWSICLFSNKTESMKFHFC